jgi:hypothetical protein
MRVRSLSQHVLRFTSDSEAQDADPGAIEPRLWEKELVAPGEYYPVPNEPVEVTTDDLQAWVTAFNKMKSQGVEVPLYLGHVDSMDDTAPERRVGVVRDMYIKPNSQGEVSLYGLIEFSDKDYHASQVSIFAEPDVYDGLNTYYEHAITHVAITDVPVVPGLEEFQPVDERDVQGEIADVVQSRGHRRYSREGSLKTPSASLSLSLITKPGSALGLSTFVRDVPVSQPRRFAQQSKRQRLGKKLGAMLGQANVSNHALGFSQEDEDENQIEGGDATITDITGEGATEITIEDAQNVKITNTPQPTEEEFDGESLPSAEEIEEEGLNDELPEEGAPDDVIEGTDIPFPRSSEEIQNIARLLRIDIEGKDDIALLNEISDIVSQQLQSKVPANAPDELSLNNRRNNSRRKLSRTDNLNRNENMSTTRFGRWNKPKVSRTTRPTRLSRAGTPADAERDEEPTTHSLSTAGARKRATRLARTRLSQRKQHRFAQETLENLAGVNFDIDPEGYVDISGTLDNGVEILGVWDAQNDVLEASMQIDDMITNAHIVGSFKTLDDIEELKEDEFVEFFQEAVEVPLEQIFEAADGEDIDIHDYYDIDDAPEDAPEDVPEDEDEDEDEDENEAAGKSKNKDEKLSRRRLSRLQRMSQLTNRFSRGAAPTRSVTQSRQRFARGINPKTTQLGTRQQSSSPSLEKENFELRLSLATSQRQLTPAQARQWRTEFAQAERTGAVKTVALALNTTLKTMKPQGSYDGTSKTGIQYSLPQGTEQSSGVNPVDAYIQRMSQKNNTTNRY